MTILRPLLGKSKLPHIVAILAVLGFTGLCSGQIAEQVVNDGAFAYWTFNDAGASNVADNLGSNANQRANYSEGVQFETGIADSNFSAIRLDGSGARLDIANSSIINTGGPWDAKTVELWFSADDVGTSNEQILFEEGGATRAITMYIRDSKVFVGAHNSSVQGPGSWPGGAENSGSLDNDFLFVSTPIQDNTPYHLTFVYDGDADGLDGTVSGYLNGELFGSEAGAGLLYAHTDNVTVGSVRGTATFDRSAGAGLSGECIVADRICYGNDPDNPNHFAGVVDDVALYNLALTATQVKAHYDARNYVAGDFDGSGSLDFTDFLQLTSNFNLPGTYSEGDINFDGQIDLTDFSVFRRFYGQANPANAAVVPEPSSSMLVLLAAFALPMFRRKRTR